MADTYRCPKCSIECIREVVDVGPCDVTGPWTCPGCGWSENDLVTELLGVPSFGCEEKAEQREVCPGCKNEIDPDLCCCGNGREGHGYCEHNFVPMGCDCGRVK